MQAQHPHSFVSAIVRKFLHSNLSLLLIVLALLVGATALLVTPREEDPQIVVPMADVFVQFPGRSATEVERLVATPLERILYQIDGVEHVYSMSKPDEAIVTVRFYVGQDRERSLVKLYNKIEQNLDLVPDGVTGWVVKPVEIDDVPIVSFTLTSSTAGDYLLRRVAEEAVQRLSAIGEVSRSYVVGGRPRQVRIEIDPQRLAAHHLTPLEVVRSLRATNVRLTAGDFARGDQEALVEVGRTLTARRDLEALVVGVSGPSPIFLGDVAEIGDGPAEVTQYVRWGAGPAWGSFVEEAGAPGTWIGSEPPENEPRVVRPAVTIAVAKKRGTNAVRVAQDAVALMERIKRDVLPDDVRVVISRNYGRTADEKVNELIEALSLAVLIVIALLALALGPREALIVAVAIPIVFGMTLAVNLLSGYTINRVTLFALILSLGLLVDDPIVDVENIVRHFRGRRKASRQIVLEAVNEVRPPLITATLAVIVSFLPMFFITGMMGPYMRPMALNVPVAMVMSMVVSFTITPWLTYHVLRRHCAAGGTGAIAEDHDLTADAKTTFLYKLFHPLMAPLLHSRRAAYGFLAVVGVLTLAACTLAATRHVPLKMLPFDNKNELALVLDFDEGTTLERTDAAVRAFESYLETVPEVVSFVSYVGVASPMDFNGLVRHYYLRRGPNVADIRVDLAGKKHRRQQSHGLGLRLRPELERIAAEWGANLKLVETPPGPPVIATIVAEITGSPAHGYDDLIAAAKTVRRRLVLEPGVRDADDSVESAERKFRFVVDAEKAALSGVSVEEVAQTVRLALGGHSAGQLRVAAERNPLELIVRLPEASRSNIQDLAAIYVKDRQGRMLPLSELGTWHELTLEKTIYHKDLRQVAYVFAEAAGRPPAEAVVDVEADRATIDEAPAAATNLQRVGSGWIDASNPRPLSGRTYLTNGGGLPWAVPEGISVDFAGEGEWQITLDVFRDLGLAFAAALVGIYILLVNQTGSFALPIVVMMAIPLTVIGIMPGFWLLNAVAGQTVAGYADPVFFTATAMIGMIALAGIVTRDAIILVDFIHLSQEAGHSLFDAIMLSRVVRLRPILLTALSAMLGALPITLDPIFSGLAWSLIFGLFSSTLFTLFVIPVVYWLLYSKKTAQV